MKDQQVHDMKLPILEKLDCLVKSTRNFADLIATAEKESLISSLEKDTIVTKFETEDDQQRAFYLLLNSKSCPSTSIQNLLNSTENENVISILAEKKPTEKEEWDKLQKVVKDNIDRLSSHTMNLGMVLSFATGVGLISGKDREIIANHSPLEIDQLKQFYSTVSGKQEDAYGKLLKVLKMTNNNWALSVLQISEPVEFD